ncbi:MULTISPECIES: class I SAM-dependent methyltransferase [Methylobacterium]|jgi:hypothetical protein|uniref:Class I SAM-dependent methyltransferase n=2 Tax=Methylobacterium TaxID=407 RepID=A0A0C6F7W3_9HYPH|nr:MULTISPECIES: class I SAM-dependent methyltransferase [Methylobacterium]MBZ6415086.1 class I SAM-dependent methyltransferase [Methylobacterium sp.]MBK3397356.1 class I SAM-dependent methyltransferase [Methylobacterium ajmalii]MBK3412587.1 class I SAM-dependent methyltransferase [Methylobacterium ajmalii]MBK3421597.1 class I SAM-dependent methyltransferase [Methylobacterium ajmalii]SFF32001.1 Methyltransferase domain-containing protein [Methylobacterium sp. yr596]
MQLLHTKPAPGEDCFARVGGVNYLEILKAIHRNLRPATYLEVGTFTGNTLRLSHCPTIAVDPEFRITGGLPAECQVLHLFQKTSDAFFKDHDPTAIFGAPIDLAFLDGMHRFEFLLRDLIHTEAHCRPNSVVVLHDCLPGDAHITARSMNDPRRAQSRNPDFWAGDVWKLLPILRRYRPDIRALATDAAPTGLVFLTNLNPASTVLQQHYFDIVAEWLAVDLADYGVARLIDEAEPVAARQLVSPEFCANRFWL